MNELVAGDGLTNQHRVKYQHVPEGDVHAVADCRFIHRDVDHSELLCSPAEDLLSA